MEDHSRLKHPAATFEIRNCATEYLVGVQVFCVGGGGGGGGGGRGGGGRGRRRKCCRFLRKQDVYRIGEIADHRRSSEDLVWFRHLRLEGIGGKRQPGDSHSKKWLENHRPVRIWDSSRWNAETSLFDEGCWGTMERLQY